MSDVVLTVKYELHARLVAEARAEGRAEVLAAVRDQAAAFDYLSKAAEGKPHTAAYGFSEAASHLRAMIGEAGGT